MSPAVGPLPTLVWMEPRWGGLSSASGEVIIQLDYKGPAGTCATMRDVSGRASRGRES